MALRRYPIMYRARGSPTLPTEPMFSSASLLCVPASPPNPLLVCESPMLTVMPLGAASYCSWKTAVVKGFAIAGSFRLMRRTVSK